MSFFFFFLKTNQLLDAFPFFVVVHWQAYPMFIGYSKIFSLLSEETSIQDTEKVVQEATDKAFFLPFQAKQSTTTRLSSYLKAYYVPPTRALMLNLNRLIGKGQEEPGS